MDGADPRAALAALIRERRADCAALSRLIGRNAAYVQQFIARGTPRRLAEADRAVLARYFGVAESVLGGPEAERTAPALRAVPRFDLAASAGPGALVPDERAVAELGFSDAWLRRLKPAGALDRLSVIAVTGTSMQPTLEPGDEILVDLSDTMRRDGVFVLRFGDALMVKRLRRDGPRIVAASDNPDADPVPAGAFAVVGRVLWAGRRL